MQSHAARPGAPRRRWRTFKSEARFVRLVDPDVALDDEVIRDKCGVVGIAGRTSAGPLLYYALHALQHRGQESAGVSVDDGAARGTHKAMGLVDQAIPPATLMALPGDVGIGHVRYSTTGGSF